MQVSGWQRANIQAAATYLRERMTAGQVDAKTKAIYDGLLEVLDPTRRTLRLQREAASARAVPVTSARERRMRIERRAHDRRAAALGPPSSVERRAGGDRRRGRDRRTR
jgi:hypothetical protein